MDYNSSVLVVYFISVASCWMIHGDKRTSQRLETCPTIGPILYWFFFACRNSLDDSSKQSFLRKCVTRPITFRPTASGFCNSFHLTAFTCTPCERGLFLCLHTANWHLFMFDCIFAATVIATKLTDQHFCGLKSCKQEPERMRTVLISY